MKVEEVIVVEGMNDRVAIERAVCADTIETRGSALGEEVIARVKKAQKTRGVILFTDPDGAGERIRRILADKVPGCKHAFLPRNQARGKGKIGVEHASPTAIRAALQDVRSELDTTLPNSDITWAEFIDAGMVGGAEARQLREKMGQLLGIGYGNAKQFYRRLHLFRIQRDEWAQALHQVREG
ncbi:ribonuclease M5 [Mechercharimyces sp. CAU 1602]|uniref:ribonuclease M5 n=1 Tax=Mechercharimyces sp. CAU 1602 TaxID=2973933 RepID=UPI0021633299|nr:ribonuclease M5 [Mechercharimyces sp. CAU 1602]MCS1352367.1 ribonuclease M5 [Mechercharimyces sp. CAU 1602]